jgi:hypothetical protein
MKNSGSLDEEENQIKSDFSKSEVARIFSHFKCGNEVRRKENVNKP